MIALIAVTSFIKTVWNFASAPFKSNAPAKTKNETAAILIVLALIAGAVIVFGILVRGCYVGKKIEKTAAAIANTKTATVQSESQIEILQEEKKEIADERDNLQKQATAANTAYNAVLNTDSGTRDPDFGAVRRKWCAGHRHDSKCR